MDKQKLIYNVRKIVDKFVYWAYIGQLGIFGKVFWGGIRFFNSQIKITNNCNSRCITCNIWKNLKRDWMKYDDYKKGVLKLKAYGLKSVGLTGGEPLLHNQVEKFCKFAKEQGLAVSISTNGLWLDRKWKKLIEWIDQINVSIDGIGITNDEIRGVNGYFDKVIKTLKIIRRKYPDKKILISTTITDDNIGQIEKLLVMCQRYKFVWSFNLLCNSLYFFKNISFENRSVKKGQENLMDLLMKYKKRGVVEFSNPAMRYGVSFLNKTQVKQKCFLGLTSVFLDTKLNWYTGCWAMPPVGNLVKENVDTIIGKRKFKDRISNMVMTKCPGCTCGFDESAEINDIKGYFAEKLIGKFIK